MPLPFCVNEKIVKFSARLFVYRFIHMENGIMTQKNIFGNIRGQGNL